MNFYTDVLLLGDDILFRGYENGSAVQYREKCRPTLYFVPREQSKESKYKTLDGRYAHPKRFDGQGMLAHSSSSIKTLMV